MDELDTAYAPKLRGVFALFPRHYQRECRSSCASDHHLTTVIFSISLVDGFVVKLCSGNVEGFIRRRHGRKGGSYTGSQYIWGH